jgi:hypothetical protein
LATVALAKQSFAADPDLVAGTAMYTAGMPTGASPDGNMNQYAVKVNYFLNGKDATGGLGVATVPVPNIMPTAGLPNPTAAQVSAASAAKAKAIVDAVNGAKLPGVSVAVDPKTQPGGMYPTGQTMKQNVFVPGRGNVQVDVPVLAPADFTSFTYTGVRQSVGADGKLGSPVFKTAVNAKTGKEVSGVNVTGEVGNGKGNFQQGTGGSTSPGSMFKGSLNGPGSGMGSSTGMDASLNQSVVGFGFIDETSSTPTDYIAAFDPQAGMTDYDVLNDLAAVFNADYSSSGYTATYDPGSDTLSIDQMLPAAAILWDGNSDTGLFFDSNAEVPEPASLSLLALGGVTLLGRRRPA